MHSPKLQEFLERLGRELKGIKKRNAVLEEISSHIQDAAEHFLEQGLNEDEALEKAIARLGNVKKLGRSLRAAHRPWFLRWTVLVPSTFAIALIAGVTVLTVLADQYLDDAEGSIRNRARAFELYLQDQASLQKYSYLRPPTRARDAGVFLNERILWEGSGVTEKYRNPTIALSAEQQKLLIRGPEWIHQREPESLKKIDLSWMAALKKYDHWDLWATAGPAKDNLNLRSNWMVVPVPDYGSLRAMAKLRFLRAFRNKDALNALREVRQLGVLINSNEMPISEVMFTGMLAMEERFYREAVKRKLLKTGEWQPMPEADRKAYKRVAYSAAEWLALISPPEYAQKMEAHVGNFVGVCGAFLESNSMRALTLRFFENHVWPERDMGPHLNRLARLEEKYSKECRLSYREAASPHMDFNYTENAAFYWFYYYEWGKKIPLVRRYIGADLYLRAMPNGLDNTYRDLIAEESSKKDRAPASK